MNQTRDTANRDLRRLLANGPLSGVPKRPADQGLLVALAAAQFDVRRTYLEAEVNEKLIDWLASFCEPYAIDHVTLRRMLVDSRLLSRTTSGSSYRINPARQAEIEAVGTIMPVEVLAEIRSARAFRKSQHAP